MIGARGLVVMFGITSLIFILILGYQDRLDPKTMCKSANAHLIDRCAKTGGLSR